MTGPDVSVIVPVRDGVQTLPALLESLGRQTLAQHRFEVIVVDNGSRDGTDDLARAAGVRVITEARPNRARARNIGAAAARSGLLAFTDADCVATPGWLEGLLACAGRAPLLAGAVRVTTGEPPNDVERFERLWRFEQEAWTQEGWAATANLLMEKKALQAIGGFDSAYRHIGEDADMCVRAGRAGFSLAFCPDAEILHHAENTLQPMLRRMFWHGYSSAQVHRRVGVGYEAWRRPRPLLDPDAAARTIGIDGSAMSPEELQRMSRLAQVAYGVRVAGSGWALAQRVR